MGRVNTHSLAVNAHLMYACKCMNNSAERRRSLLAAAADPSRQRILREIFPGSKHVSQIAEVLGLSQSCTTRHVQCLEAAGLVCPERAGKRVMVRVSPQDEQARALLSWLGWDDAGTDPARLNPVVKRSTRSPRAVRRRPGSAGGAESRLRAEPTPEPAGCGTQEEAHAPAPSSDTPQEPPVHEAPRAPVRRQTLEDFLL